MTARTRERDKAPEYEDLVMVNDMGPGDWGTYPYPPVSYLSFSQHESMSDVVTKNWRGKISQGAIINNPCVYESKRVSMSWPYGAPKEQNVFISGPSGTWDAVASGNYTAAMMQVFNPYLWDKNEATVPNFDAEADAKQRCLGRVDSTPYEFFEDLLEIRETLQFLSGPLKGISDLAKAFQQKYYRIQKIEQGEDLVRALANLWNQYRFAFLPLLRSVTGLWDVYERWNDIERPARRNSHGRSESALARTPTFSSTLWAGRYYAYWYKNSFAQKKGHATIIYEVTNPLVDWKFKLGLRSKDIPKVAWEIIPLSFLVDRLFDVKHMIMGLLNLADPSVAILAGSYTERTEKKLDFSCYQINDLYSYFTWNIAKRGAVSVENYSYEREVWAPSVLDIFPVWDPHGLVKDVTKVLDLIAVTISRLPH